MAQQNEPNHFFDPATVPVKRKRGRPRKEDVPGTESSGRTQRRRRNPPPTTGPGLVGQPISGILDGAFDAGFLVTVRVGNSGPLLRGMVFDSRLCVPISVANDVAPHIKMSRREEIPISAESLQRRGPNLSSPNSNKGVFNDGSQGSALTSKGSEAVISVLHPTITKHMASATVQTPDNQRQELTGEPKLDIPRKASESFVTAGEAKLGSKSRMEPGSGEPKLDCESPITRGTEAAGELKFFSTRQTSGGNEALSELKPGSTSRTPPVNEAAGEQKLGTTDQMTLVHETVVPKIEFASEMSPERRGLPPVCELDSMKAEIQNGCEQVKSSTSVVATQLDFRCQF